MPSSSTLSTLKVTLSKKKCHRGQIDLKKPLAISPITIESTNPDFWLHFHSWQFNDRSGLNYTFANI
jgi:hypothetical protein